MYYILILLLSSLLLSIGSCSSPSAPIHQLPTKSNFEQQLDSTSYAELFMYSRHEALIDIWDGGNTESQLRILIQQKTTHPFTKLKAAEILFYYQKTIAPEYYTTLAQAYAYSLAHSSFDQKNPTLLNGNVWGLLYEEDDLGVLGSRFLQFDTAAISPLIQLLDDHNSRILYEGSEEATIGNGYQFRIKDFAAFYLSKITATPIIFHPQNIKKRDQAIEKLWKEIHYK